MKRLIGSLLCAALLWTSGPIPVWAQQVQASVSAAPFSGAAAQAGAAAALKLQLGPQSLDASRAGLSSGGSVLPSLQTPQALRPHASALVATVIAAAPSTPLSAQNASILLAPASRSLAVRPAPAKAAAAEAVPRASAQAVLETAGQALGRQASESRSERAGLLQAVFDGRALKPAAQDSDPVTAPETARQASGLASRAQASPAAASEGTPAPAAKTENPKKGLPFSYTLYLGAQILYALGQEASTLIAPLYAYFQQGLGFAVLAQVVDLVSIIPGSMLGDWLVRRFDSKKVYLGGIAVHALAFLSVPALYALTGAFSPVHFLAFKVVSGLIYGALRGVAEKEIPSRILGQEDMDRLKTAGSMFYAAFEVAELIAAVATTALIAALSLNGASLVMGAVMLSSVLPILFIRFRQGAPVDEGGEAGAERRLPLSAYLPFVFSLCTHILLYCFLAPFMALEVFHSEALNSQLIAFYTGGSLLVALFSAYLPKLSNKLSEKGWTAVGILATVAFLWATLLLQIPWLSMGLAALLGVGLTATQIQWRAVYQKRLALDVQPKVFKWLSIGGILAAIVPSIVLQGGLILHVSMPFLLGVVAAGITAAALGVPLALKLVEKVQKA